MSPIQISWATTIRKNFNHYQPEFKIIIPEVCLVFGRKRKVLKDILLCIDQNGSRGSPMV